MCSMVRGGLGYVVTDGCGALLSRAIVHVGLHDVVSIWSLLCRPRCTRSMAKKFASRFNKLEDYVFQNAVSECA